MKEIIEDIANLDSDFKKLEQNDINECNFLKQQVNTLIQEKMAVQQDAIKLDTRISTIEGEVGYE